MDLFQLGFRSIHDVLNGTKMIGQNLGCTLANVPDAETKEQPPEFERPAGLNLADEIIGRLPSHALEFFELFCLQGVEIGNISNQSLLNQLIDETFTKTIDFHRLSAGPVKKGFFDLGGTGLRNAPP